MELCTVAICYKKLRHVCDFSACGCRTSKNMVFLLQIKFPSLNLPGQCGIEICQVHVISLEDEVTIAELVLKCLNAEVDHTTALFLPGRLIQLSACGGLAEEPYHSHFTISHHVEVTTHTVVGCVSLEDKCSGVLQEVEFLAL